MLDTLAQLPFWQAFVALFVIVMARSNATYWVGRGAIHGWRRVRAPGDSAPGPRPDSGPSPAAGPPSVSGRGPDSDPDPGSGSGSGSGFDTASEGRQRAEALIRRWGPVAVALSYLTIGIQTTIHLAAGAVRMPMVAYVPGAVVGSAMWAALYATVGLAAVQAWIAAQAGSWYSLAALGGLVVVALVTWLLGRRRSQRLNGAAP